MPNFQFEHRGGAWRDDATSPQFYSTFLVDDPTDLLVQIVTVPTRSLTDRAFVNDVDALLQMLELQPSGRRHSADPEGALRQYIEDTIRPLRTSTAAIGSEGRDLFDAASRIYTAAIVPFESSPLKATSLRDLLTGVGVPSAAVVWATAVTPQGDLELMIALMPLGIVILGAARGLARGLEQGLEQRVLKLLTRKARTSGSAPPGGGKPRPRSPQRPQTKDEH